MTSFITRAAYYEALADKPGRLDREGPMLLRLLSAAPGRRVVDLACGTGIHALFLADQGAEVTALDLSEEMILHAQRIRPHEDIHYEMSDMRTVSGGPWDMAIFLGNSLSLLESRLDLNNAFRSLASVLNPGAVILTQTLNYEAEGAQEARHRVERTAIDHGDLVAVKSLVPYGSRTLLSLSFFADQGDHIDRVSENAVLRNWTPEDIEKAAATANLKVAKVSGGFDGSPLDSASSSDVVIELTKPR